MAYNASDSNGNNGRHGKKKNDRYYKSSDSRDNQNSSMPMIVYQQDSNTRSKSNSNLIINSFAVFYRNLPLFLSTLATVACFKATKRFNDKIDTHLRDEWLGQHFSLAAVFSANVLVNGFQVEALILSDTGASISFVSAAFITKHCLQPIGTWVGQIMTLTTTENVRTPFFKVTVINGESTKQIICLKIEDLGHFHSLPSPAYLKFGAHYGILP